MKTLLISTAIIAITQVQARAETIPFCKDVPAYTDCQSPNGSGGWTMIVFNLTEKERKYLREVAKRTEAQRKNTEEIKKLTRIDYSTAIPCCGYFSESGELQISTSVGKIIVTDGARSIEVPKIAFCQAWGHVPKRRLNWGSDESYSQGNECYICGKKIVLRNHWEVLYP